MACYRSFLFPEARIEGGSIFLDPRESGHLVRVFRAKVGEAVEVLNGKGHRYSGPIVRATSKSVQIRIDSEEFELPMKSRVTLLQSIPKGKAMDRILRIAAEIGVSAVQPVFSAQGEVRIQGQRLLSKMEKWQLTLIESCKQCGLPYLPKLHAPVPIETWLDTRNTTESTLCIVASLQETGRPLSEELDLAREPDRVVVAVGPEGDFTTKEYARFEAFGFKPVRLSAHVLRAETAAAYILSVLDQYTQSRA